MTSRTRYAAALAALSFLGPIGGASAQNDLMDAQRRQLRTAQALHATVEGLAGDLSHERERIDLVMEMLAKTKAQQDELARISKSVADFVKATERGNQKEAFFDELIRWACKNMQDNCELRRRFDELEARIRHLENGNRLEPTPTPVDPMPMPTPIAPAPENYQPGMPRLWVGPVHFITDQPAYVAPYARLVERCVNLDSADGILCHGDIYQDGYGRFILLKHTPRYQYRSVLAAR